MGCMAHRAARESCQLTCLACPSHCRCLARRLAGRAGRERVPCGAVGAGQGVPARNKAKNKGKNRKRDKGGAGLFLANQK